MTSHQPHHAHTAAISMAHGMAIADALRAHGLDWHADNITAALSEFAAITESQVGERPFKRALHDVHLDCL